MFRRQQPRPRWNSVSGCCSKAFDTFEAAYAAPGATIRGGAASHRPDLAAARLQAGDDPLTILPRSKTPVGPPRGCLDDAAPPVPTELSGTPHPSRRGAGVVPGPAPYPSVPPL